jgi:hypothetical protein
MKNASIFEAFFMGPAVAAALAFGRQSMPEGQDCRGAFDCATRAQRISARRLYSAHQFYILTAILLIKSVLLYIKNRLALKADRWTIHVTCFSNPSTLDSIIATWIPAPADVFARLGQLEPDHRAMQPDERMGFDAS